MKFKYIILLVILISISCTDDFDSINIDPTKNAVVPTSTLFTAALQDLTTLNSSLGGNKTLMLYTQQWSQREETGRSRYGDAERDWGSWYLSGLPELNKIIELNSGENASDFLGSGATANQIAVAKIMRAWVFMNITDTWGNVPYSEAHNTEIITPVYDEQQQIYSGIISELTAAASMINTSGDPMQGDIMYGGDLTKWVKFANSLRARLAMRMSEVDPAMAQAVLNDALSSPVFESNDDNATVSFQEELSLSNPLFQEFQVQFWTYISKPMVDLMTLDNTISDPRLPIYAQQNDNGGYVGLPYALTDDESSSIRQDSTSHPGLAIQDAQFASKYMTYSELQFIRAEAAQRGWISGSAEDFYNDAIRASMSYWNIDATETDTYIAQSDIAYDASNWQKSIGEQKYIAAYTQGYQVWSEWRRLDYPILEFPSSQLSNNASEIPRRFFYNLSEQSLNADNLAAAVSSMGGDDFSVRVWWDK